MKAKTIVLFTLFALFACKSEPVVLDEASVRAKTNKYIAANAGNLLEPERLTETVAGAYGVLEHEHTRFLEIYQRFLKYRSYLPDELQRADAALLLTLELSLDDPGDTLLTVPTIKEPRPEDTAYMAYLLLLGPGVETALLADVGYVQYLAGLFQVTPRAIKRGLWIALQQDLDTLANALVGSMEAELKKGATLSAENFANKVLIPFLTYVNRGFTLSPENESAVADAFGRAFGDAKEFQQAFDELRYHINGQEPAIKKLHQLNSKLLEKNTFIYVVPGQITLQEPLNYQIKVDRKELSTVRATKGRGLAMRSLSLGCWPYANREIIVAVDELMSHRDIHRALLDQGTMPFAITDDVKRLWSRQGMEHEASSVTALYRDLASKAFDGADDKTLLADLFFNAALLQLRCLVDLGSSANLDNVDRAIAAYSAQMVLGRRPELMLIDFIQYVQDTRLKSSSIDDNNRLDSLLKTLWKLASDRQSDTLDGDGLKTAVRALHDAHVPLKSKKLPDLGAFERDIVKTYLVAAPAFTMP